jgi:branched-chain amino acid transport system substrate-binding protein
MGLAPFQIKAADAVKVAAIFAQTGEAATDHASSIQGVQFAVKEINNKGGILGRKIELILIDNGSTPIGSKVAADKAVEAGVLAIFGSAWSEHTLAIAKVAQANHTLMITNTSTHPDITQIGNYIFRVCFTDLFQGEILARFALSDLKGKSAAILKKVSSDYSIKLAQEFKKHFEKGGGRVILELNYLQNDKEFIPSLKKVKQVRPDIFFIPGHDESGIILKQAQELGIEAVFLGGDGWGGLGFYQNGGQELKQGFYSSHWSPEMENEKSRDFVKRYRPQFIDAGTVLSYDSVFLLADAIARAGSFDKEKIREALAQTRNFHGVTGDISFYGSGDPVKSVVINKIINGKERYLKTYKP